MIYQARVTANFVTFYSDRYGMPRSFLTTPELETFIKKNFRHWFGNYYRVHTDSNYFVQLLIADHSEKKRFVNYETSSPDDTFEDAWEKHLNEGERVVYFHILDPKGRVHRGHV